MLSSPYPMPPVRGWRVATVGSYLAASAAGVWSLIVPPALYTETVPTWITFLWSMSLIGGGLVCAIGVAVAQYRAEWIASWSLGLGIAIHAVISWAMTTHSPAAGTRALMLTAFTGVVVARALLLWRIDRLARDRKRVADQREDE